MSFKFKQETEPSSPAPGENKLFADSADSLIKSKDSSGVVRILGNLNIVLSSLFRVADTTDPTKQFAIDVSAISPSTTRTIQIPDSDIDLANIIFGGEFGFSESLGFSSTTSVTYIQKLRHTTPVIPAGNYMIKWSVRMGATGGDSAPEWRVQLDDTTDLIEALLNGDKIAIGRLDPHGGHAIVTLSNAAHDIDIDFRKGTGAPTADISFVRISIWRVS